MLKSLASSAARKGEAEEEVRRFVGVSCFRWCPLSIGKSPPKSNQIIEMMRKPFAPALIGWNALEWLTLFDWLKLKTVAFVVITESFGRLIAGPH